MNHNKYYGYIYRPKNFLKSSQEYTQEFFKKQENQQQPAYGYKTIIINL